MDYETADAAEFGAALRGLGLNLLVSDVARTATFLTDVFEMQAHQVTRDFAIVTYGRDVFQLHGDHTYHSNPLPSLVPEAGARGGGAELRLFDTDPDQATARARKAGAVILAAPEDKPHGLREAIILDPDGYAWIPSRPLTTPTP